MRVIFSRKGFDSSAGGFPNPIFPDGTLYMVPIPDESSNVFYSDLTFKYEDDSIRKILNDLTGRRIRIKGKMKFCDYNERYFKCHLDPMEINTSGFKGIAFGQTNSSVCHLLKHGVGKDDVFLFFSWFREVEKRGERWRYKP